MIAILLALLVGTDTAPAAATAEIATEAQPAFTFRGHVEWISAAGGTAFRDTEVNPGNRVLGLPQVAAETELRPHLRVEYGSVLEGIARPRLLLQVTRAAAGGAWQAELSTASATWTELYASWRLDDRVAIAYGRQSFQWGPAELLSPSNRIFHESGFLRDPLYLVRGKELARVNVTFAKEWTAVLLAEVAPNGEPAFVAGERFEPKAQLKLEYAAPGGGYVGATGGAAPRSRAWFGEYGDLPLWGGLSAYADAVHTVGRLAWYPVDDGAGGATFALGGMDTRRLETLVVGGVRYVFDDGVDVRLEYVHDDAGYGRRALELSSRAARAPAQSEAVLGPYLDPGFELPGRDLGYVSVRLQELPPGRRTQVQVRYLLPERDGVPDGRRAPRRAPRRARGDRGLQRGARDDRAPRHPGPGLDLPHP